MKKLYGLMMLAMLAFCSVAIISCGDDDDDSLVGTWRWDGIDEEGDQAYDEFTFTKDGRYVWTDGFLDGSTWDVDTETGRYTAGGGVITLYPDGESSYSLGYTLKGKALTIVDGSYSRTLRKK